MRRFNEKVAFGFLKPDGVEHFYRKYQAPLTSEPINRRLLDRLRSVPDLAPGDFKIVHDRFRFQTVGRVIHRDMVEALSRESKIKKSQAGKTILGFGR